MTKVNLIFKDFDQIRSFVKIVSESGCNADMKYGNHVVDASSIIGVMALAQAKMVELIIYGDDELCRKLKDNIGLFAA